MEARPELEPLLEACMASPEDDEPRLVWADAVGGERGELVVIQCDLGRGNLGPAEVVARRRRERELLARHGAAWSRLSGLAAGAVFRRGFVEVASVDAAVLIERPGELFRAAPLLRSISLHGITGRLDYRRWDDPAPVRSGPDTLEVLRRVFRILDGDPRAAQIRGLAVSGAGTAIDRNTMEDRYDFESLAHEAAEIYARSETLKRLRAFSFDLTTDAIFSLRPHLSQLERLWTPVLTEAQAGLLFEADLSSLRSLRAAPADYRGLAVPKSARLVELQTGWLDDALLAELAESPLGQSLEHLTLYRLGILEDPSPLTRFPRLRSLRLPYVSFGRDRDPGAQKAAVRAFSMTSLPALRELGLATLSTPTGSVRLLAAAFGAQLELLDLRTHQLHDELREALAGMVAGELVLGPGRPSEVEGDNLIHVGDDRARRTTVVVP